MKVFIIALLALTSCAHLRTRPALQTYRCGAEPEMCKLVDYAAQAATRDGFVTYRDDADTTWVFLPSPTRTVFFKKYVPQVNGLDMVPRDLIPAIHPVEIHGQTVEIHARLGGVDLRAGDLVGIFQDIFEGRL